MLRVLGLVTIAACAAPTNPDFVDPFGDGGKADGGSITNEPTRYPIVLVHGFNASPTNGGFGPDVVAALCADGHSVYAPALPPYASVATRAAVLADTVDAALAGDTDACGNTPVGAPDKVNLVAHSMGGLDSRFVISSLGYGDRVASLTTLSTPHRGSAIADMALGLLANVDDSALNAFAALLERPLDTPSTEPSDLHAALTALAESTSVQFNADNLDDARVRYQSWAGLSNVAGIPNPQDKAACNGKLAGFDHAFDRHVMHVLLKPIAAAVAHGLDLRPNDGLVQVASAQWGTFRGCVPADHLDEVGALPGSKFPTVTWARGRAFELASTGL